MVRYVVLLANIYLHISSYIAAFTLRMICSQNTSMYCPVLKPKNTLYNKAKMIIIIKIIIRLHSCLLLIFLRFQNAPLATMWVTWWSCEMWVGQHNFVQRLWLYQVFQPVTYGKIKPCFFEDPVEGEDRNDEGIYSRLILLSYIPSNDRKRQISVYHWSV